MSVFEYLLDESQEYQTIYRAVKDGMSPIHVSGVMDAEKAQLIYSLSCHLGKHVFVLTPNDAASRKIEANASVLFSSCVRLDEKELQLRTFDAVGHDEAFERLSALAFIETSEVVVASVGALLQLIMPKHVFDEKTIVFSVGKSFDLPTLSARLSAMGYVRCDTVEERGQFAVRGGIVDVFSPDALKPVRMEFFGDEIDSLRSFDSITQLSDERLSEAVVIPAADLEETGSLLSYIPKEYLVVLDEPMRLSEQAEAIKLTLEEKVKTLLEAEQLTEVRERYLNDYTLLMADLLTRQVVSLSTLSLSTPDFRPVKLLSLSVKSMQPYGGNTELLLQDIAYYRERNYRILVMAGASERLKTLRGMLVEQGLSVTSEQEALPARGTVLLLRGSFSGGYEYPLIKTVVISDRELLREERKRRRRHRSGMADIGDYAELSPGDYVVHEIHGIGRFDGLVRIQAAGSIKDYLKIIYRGDDVLYVPVGQLNFLHKYKGAIESGAEEKKPVRLNKLGGAEWQKTKSSVKQNVVELAEKLVRLYAERQHLIGHSFPSDTPWQRDFEAEFLYEETEDQLRSIEEMKADMQSNRPMDRLLCGDVGFGKTEVAMRGAFKCVTDNHQVAYLVPTTVLAAQQYSNFVQRMKNYPITVEMLSRFRTPKEQKEILRKVKSGEVDILIGTHRMLQKDVTFKNLGLLIVDEEHRFGVAHKEAIKQLKAGVDVLSLSATPIPRSLNMAMIGIRDMSVLTMPPEDRLPVQTFAMEYNEAVIGEAIGRELSRRGQVYYLYNRVSGIYSVADRLQKRFPEARIAVGHGQMNERELEDIMMQMVEGDIDILVCTTIIETGLDIPNVNTIIIEEADRMGLSQLYQLRGRVGRSSRLAYAYLTYRRDKVLTEVAEKRLKAIREFTEFGSGFRIAMRDLELRGAGNVLGPEQSGFMSSVGYEVYCQILSEAVAEAKGEPPAEKQECLVDLDINAYIPETYIQSGVTRIQMYKKIAGIESLSDSYAVQEELEDRFGDIPAPTNRLIDVAMIRSEAVEASVEELTQKNEKLLFYMRHDTADLPGRIAALNGVFRGKVMFSASDRPCIHVRCGALSPDETLGFVKKVLQNLKNKE